MTRDQVRTRISGLMREAAQAGKRDLARALADQESRVAIAMASVDALVAATPVHAVTRSVFRETWNDLADAGAFRAGVYASPETWLLKRYGVRTAEELTAAQFEDALSGLQAWLARQRGLTIAKVPDDG
jgi:hypothetical protein